MAKPDYAVRRGLGRESNATCCRVLIRRLRSAGQPVELIDAVRRQVSPIPGAGRSSANNAANGDHGLAALLWPHATFARSSPRSPRAKDSYVLLHGLITGRARSNLEPLPHGKPRERCALPGAGNRAPFYCPTWCGHAAGRGQEPSHRRPGVPSSSTFRRGLRGWSRPSLALTHDGQPHYRKTARNFRSP